jgi:hypothetical protein
MTIGLPLAGLVKCEKTWIICILFYEKKLSINVFRKVFCYFVLYQF